MRLHLLCEKSGASHTPSTSASGYYGSPAGRQSDEILVDFNFLEISTDRIVRILRRLMKVKCYYNVTNAAFCGKVCIL